MLQLGYQSPRKVGEDQKKKGLRVHRSPVFQLKVGTKPKKKKKEGLHVRRVLCFSLTFQK